jgi:hypothetical protein
LFIFDPLAMETDDEDDNNSLGFEEDGNVVEIPIPPESPEELKLTSENVVSEMNPVTQTSVLNELPKEEKQEEKQPEKVQEEGDFIPIVY